MKNVFKCLALTVCLTMSVNSFGSHFEGPSGEYIAKKSCYADLRKHIRACRKGELEYKETVVSVDGESDSQVSFFNHDGHSEAYLCSKKTGYPIIPYRFMGVTLPDDASKKIYPFYLGREMNKQMVEIITLLNVFNNKKPVSTCHIIRAEYHLNELGALVQRNKALGNSFEEKKLRELESFIADTRREIDSI